MRLIFILMATILYMMFPSSAWAGDDEPEVDVDEILELEREINKQYEGFLDEERMNRHWIPMFRAYMDATSNPDRLEKAAAYVSRHPEDPAGHYRLAVGYDMGSRALEEYLRTVELFLKDKDDMGMITKDRFMEATGAPEGIVFKKMDFDIDGAPEVLLANLNGISNWYAIIIDREDGQWRMSQYEVDGQWFRGYHIEDMNGNGRPDILFHHYQGGRGSVGFAILEYRDGKIEQLGFESDSYIHRFGEIYLGAVGKDGLRPLFIEFYVDNFKDDSGPDHRYEEYLWDGKRYSVIEDRRIEDIPSKVDVKTNGTK